MLADTENPTDMSVLNTERLRLRQWRDDDRPAFAEMNADPAVARYLPSVLTRAQSDATLDRIVAHFAAHGFGLWAVEVRDGAELIGFTGLARPRFEAHFTPCVEIGWRLRSAAWGRGFATEAAHAALAFGFAQGLSEIVSFTVPANQPSRRVMEKLGMTLEDEFDHPNVDVGHPLRRHVLYRIRRADYEARGAGSTTSSSSAPGS